MDTANDQRRVRAVGRLIFILCILGCIWIVLSAIITSQTTGMLYIKSSDPKAGLIISQAGRQAVAVGTGSAKIRLRPGSYQISALDSGKQANATEEVYKKHTTTSYLNPARLVELPSVDTISFKGTGALINVGLTTEQLSDLEQDFFQYKPSAHTININTASVEPGPYNPSVSTTFTVNFNVSIDSKLYKATIGYSGFSAIQLNLYNPQSNAVVFSSSTVSSQGGD